MNQEGLGRLAVRVRPGVPSRILCRILPDPTPQ